MSKGKKIFDVIRCELYKFDLVCSFNQTDKQFNKSLHKIGAGELNSGIHEMDSREETGSGWTALIDGVRMVVIRLNMAPDTNEDYAVLQHEIFHAVEFIMYRIGLQHSVDSGEAYAYLIQFFTEKIYDLLTD